MSGIRITQTPIRVPKPRIPLTNRAINKRIVREYNPQSIPYELAGNQDDKTILQMISFYKKRTKAPILCQSFSLHQGQKTIGSLGALIDTKSANVIPTFFDSLSDDFQGPVIALFSLLTGHKNRRKGGLKDLCSFAINNLYKDGFHQHMLIPINSKSQPIYTSFFNLMGLNTREIIQHRTEIYQLGNSILEEDSKTVVLSKDHLTQISEQLPSPIFEQAPKKIPGTYPTTV